MSNESNPFAANPNAASNPYAPTTHVSDQITGLSDVEAFRKKYLNHEASCKSIGVLYLLGAIFLVPMGVISIVAAMSQVGNDVQSSVVLGAIGVVYLSMGLFQGFVGYGLRKLQPWSRIGGSVLSAIGLIGFPIGTLISAYFLYCLLSQKGQVVFSENYRQAIQQTPHIKYKTSIIVWIFLGLLLTLLALGIGAAFFGAQR